MNLILTNQGEELASNGFLTGNFPKITKVVFGDGNGALVVPSKTMTALVHPIQEGVGTALARLANPNRLYIYTQIPSSVGGITVREVGLFTADNILIAVGGNFEKYKPPISESVEKFDFYITVPLSSAQDITVEFSNDNIYADQNAVDVITLQEETNRLNILDVTTKVVDIETNRLSIPTSYHIYNGKVSLDNTVINVGYGSYTYVGNTTVLPTIPLGMDIESQWGDNPYEKYGYLIKIRAKDVAGDWTWVDSVRGLGKYVTSASTAVEGTDNAMFTLSTVNGNTTINIGTSARTNSNTVAYIVYVFQTTHTRTWSTNHNVTELEHYNPYSGLTIIGYTGSGKLDHQLSHSLGRKLDHTMGKARSVIANWLVSAFDLAMNYTNGVAVKTDHAYTANNIILPIGGNVYNGINTTYVIYGFANSYYDENNTLIGIFEAGIYTSGSGHKTVSTRGKVGLIDIKRLFGLGNWYRWDISRPSNKALIINDSVVPSTYTLGYYGPDNFRITANDVETNNATISESYFYFMVYDNDNASGKSKYKKATDTSNITLNALIPYADGIDIKGSKVSIVYKNETITGLVLTSGRNRIYSKKDNTYGVSKYDPMMGTIRNRTAVDENPDYYDLKTEKWYSVLPVVDLISNGNIDLNTTGWTPYSGSTLSMVNGVLSITGGTNGTQGYTTVNIEQGVRYKFKYDLQLAGSAGARLVLGTSVGDSSILYFMSSNGINDNQNGKYETIFTAPYTGVLYVSLLNNGTIGSTWYADMITMFDIVPKINTEILSRNYLDCIVYADQNGQPTYIEELNKEIYVNKIVADLVTSGGFDLIFKNSKGSNGYQMLPGGLIIQWGSKVITNTSVNTLYNTQVLFPIIFPNNCLKILSVLANTPTTFSNISSETPSTTGFTIVSASGTAGSVNVNYIAIGY